jgi:hypothetical protein
MRDYNRGSLELRDVEPTPAPEVHVFYDTGVRLIGAEKWVERLSLAA